MAVILRLLSVLINKKWKVSFNPILKIFKVKGTNLSQRKMIKKQFKRIRRLNI